MLENIDMEASVLGAILNHNDFLYKVVDVLNEDCFAENFHRELYTCIKALIDEGEQVSPVRLYNRFAEKLGESNKGYIAGLTSLAKPLSLKSDVKHLADLAHRRALTQLCNVMVDRIGNFDKAGLEYASSLVTEATKIITGMAHNDSIKIAEGMNSLLQEMKSEKPVYAAKTGLSEVDNAMAGGMQKGRVYALMAAAKCGKTMLATMISNNLNDNGHKHVFICAEMGSNEIIQRMAGQRIEMPTSAFLRKDKLAVEKLSKVIETIKHNVIFEDVPGVEFEYLKSLIELHVHKSKIEGFILDYYQLVSGCEKNGTQAQHLENVANWIHKICKKHQIWCVLLVQTNDDQKVLGSRGLNRAVDQGYLLERFLDEQGDPKNNLAWLKLRFSRYTAARSIGSDTNPYLEIHENGTHFKVRKEYYSNNFNNGASYGNVEEIRFGN